MGAWSDDGMRIVAPTPVERLARSTESPHAVSFVDLDGAYCTVQKSQRVLS